jgi:hypothetical protein
MERGRVESAGVAGRMSLWGSAVVGFLAIVVALNATMSGEYVGAGVCLAAAALAFAGIGIARRADHGQT